MFNQNSANNKQIQRTWPIETPTTLISSARVSPVPRRSDLEHLANKIDFKIDENFLTSRSRPTQSDLISKFKRRRSQKARSSTKGMVRGVSSVTSTVHNQLFSGPIFLHDNYKVNRLKSIKNYEKPWLEEKSESKAKQTKNEFSTGDTIVEGVSKDQTIQRLPMTIPLKKKEIVVSNKNINVKWQEFTPLT